MSAADANFCIAVIIAAESIWIVFMLVVIKELRLQIVGYLEAIEIRKRTAESQSHTVSTLRDEVVRLNTENDDLIEQNINLVDRITLARHASDLSFPLSYRPVTPDDDA